MDKAKQAIAALPHGHITIEGHTDTTGQAEFNNQLSQRRAETVRDYLISEGAVDSTNVDAIGKGSSEPITANNTKAGRAANRRIDLMVDVGSKVPATQRTAE